MLDIVSVNAYWKNFDPESLPVNLSVVREWSEGDTDFMTVYFSGAVAADGAARIFARLARPSSKKGMVIPAVVCYGDCGGFLSEEFRALFLEEGVAVFDVDYGGRGGGKSRYTIYPDSLGNAEFGDGSGLFAPSSDLSRDCRLVWAASASRAVTALCGMDGIDRDRIAFAGEGYGTDTAWKLALIDKRLKAAIALLPRNLAGKNGQAEESARDGSITAWTSVVSPRSYAQHIRIPFLLSLASNEPDGGFDIAYQDFLRMPESECQIISVAERMSRSLRHEQADNIRLFISRFLFGEGAEFPVKPAFNISFTAEGKIRFHLKADEKLPVERAEIYYCAGGRGAAFRNWVLLKVQMSEEGEYFAEIPPGAIDRNFYVYPAVKYEGGLHICGKLIIRTPKSLGAGKGTGRISRLVYDDTMGKDCFLCDCGAAAICGGEVKTAEGPMEITGVFADGGELGTYKIGDSYFAPEPDSALVLDIACAASCELTIKLGAEDGNSEYFAKRSIVGQELWQKITVDRKDFKTKEGNMLQNWQEAAYLSVSAGSRVMISTILWA